MRDGTALFSFSDTFLLSALALSLVLACKAALQLAVGKQHSRPWVEALFGIAALVTIGVLVVDGIHWADSQTFGIEPLPGMAMIAVAMIPAWLYLQCAWLRLPAAQLRRTPVAWGLLLASVALAGWSSYRFQCAMAPPESDVPPVAAHSIKMERETELIGISDRGREIPLYHSAALPDAAASYHPVNDPRNQVKNTVIVRGDRDTQSNCHGWVFTGGRFLLDLQGIKTILEDNGYVQCDTPQTGDVIVYYISGGVAAHTGVVSGVLNDGTVIIESKWGMDGRFLHRPEDQPYSPTFTYFRTSRGSNEITIRDNPSASSLAKQRLPRKRTIKRA